MNELNAKVARILRVEAGLVVAAAMLIGLWRGSEGFFAFLAAAGVSLGSFLLLAGFARLLGGHTSGAFPVLLVVLLMGRFFLYASVISAILRIYPKRDLELLFGLLMSVGAIFLEAIYSANHDART